MHREWNARRRREHPDEVRAADRARYAANPEKYKAQAMAIYWRDWEKIRLRELARRYGITVQLYLDLHEQQRGACGICGRPEAEVPKKRLAVDHDHKTGRVRGLLCQDCNFALGLLHDDSQLLAAASKWIRNR